MFGRKVKRKTLYLQQFLMVSCEVRARITVVYRRACARVGVTRLLLA